MWSYSAIPLPGLPSSSLPPLALAFSVKWHMPVANSESQALLHCGSVKALRRLRLTYGWGETATRFAVAEYSFTIAYVWRFVNPFGGRSGTGTSVLVPIDVTLL